MKHKIVILTIATTGFLLGCSDSQNPASQNKPLDTTSQSLEAPKKVGQEATLAAEQPAIPEQPIVVERIPPQSNKALTQESLNQDVESIADALTENGTTAPRGQLEQDIKQVLEAIMEKPPAAGDDTYK